MKWKLSSIALVFVFSLSSSANGATAPHYAFSYAGSYPGAAQTYPNGVNLTLIVGYYVSTAPATLGYIQSGRAFITAQPTGSLDSYLFSINSNNLAVGGFCYASDTGACGDLSAAHGYTYDYNSGATTIIDYPGAGTTAAYGINDQGVIVGGYCVIERTGCPLDLFLGSSHGFMDDNGVFTQLDFPGADETTAFGINDSGMVVGVYEQGLSIVHAFVLENGQYTDINYPGANWSEATAVNNLGVVVGYYQAANFVVNGFMYYKGQFATVNVPGHSSAIAGINSKNDLVGTFTDSKGQNATFKAVPKN